MPATQRESTSMVLFPPPVHGCCQLLDARLMVGRGRGFSGRAYAPLPVADSLCLFSAGSRAVVPNLQGTRGRFRGRQFFFGQGRGHGSGGKCKRWGAADEALLARPLLTPCCVAQFLTGHGLVVVCSLGAGDSWPRAQASSSSSKFHLVLAGASQV